MRTLHRAHITYLGIHVIMSYAGLIYVGRNFMNRINFHRIHVECAHHVFQPCC